MQDNTANKNAANREFRKARAAEDGKRALLDYEQAAIATRAKTAKLRALRLARDAELAAAAAAAPQAEPKKKARKK
ncbi:MAG TPA: transcriptional regulator [Pseudolabrys sp.]|nr:transcriptional regulator [Pseudolabrys sp.]